MGKTVFAEDNLPLKTWLENIRKVAKCLAPQSTFEDFVVVDDFVERTVELDEDVLNLRYEKTAKQEDEDVDDNDCHLPSKRNNKRSNNYKNSRKIRP